MAFIEYELTSQALCMGERIKAGIYRPCIRTIPYSQITGALSKQFGPADLHAVGYLVEKVGYNIPGYFIYSPRDRASNVSKIPLQAEYLTNVNGRLYVVENKFSKTFLPEKLSLTMGALRSKGFGVCNMERLRTLKEEDEGMQLPKNPFDYVLNARLPEKYKQIFGIVKIFNPVYGYLFEPTSLDSGVYVRSLFEGSIVQGPRILLEKRQ